MITVIYIILVILLLLVWGIYGRLMEIHEELFELRHPKMQNDSLFADYLGKVEDDA